MHGTTDHARHMERTLQTDFYAQLDRGAERRAIGFADAAGAVEWRTWQEFHDRAASRAAALRAAGVRPGDVCLLVLPSDEACATLLAGALLAGAVPLLVAPPLLQGMQSNLTDVVARMLVRLRPTVVVMPARMANQRAEWQRRRKQTRFFFGDSELVLANGTVPLLSPKSSAVAALQLTSGTTGFPRVCEWRQHQVAAALAGMRSAMRLDSDDVCYNWTPLYHDMGLVNNFFLCLTSGVPLVMANPHDFVTRPASWLRGMAATRATVSWSPNFGFALATRKITPEQMQGVRLDHVRALWNAAERIHLPTMREFHARFAAHGLRWEAMKTNFGCAECVGGVSFSSVDAPLVFERIDGERLQTHRRADPVPESSATARAVTVVGVGRAVPGVRFHILSPRRQKLPDGRVGEIAVETPSRMQGYVRAQRENRRALHGKLLRTGDFGYKRGEELFWVGRVRERITIQGKKVDPSYFEAALHGIPALRPGCFVAFGVDDAERGTQRLVVVAEVAQPLARPLDAIRGDIQERVFRHLGLETSDTVLVPRGTLPKTSSGKRRHRHFRRLYLEGKLRNLESQGVYDEGLVHPAADEPTGVGR